MVFFVIRNVNCIEAVICHRKTLREKYVFRLTVNMSGPLPAERKISVIFPVL